MICPRCHRRYEGNGQLFCPHDGGRLVGALDVKRIRSKPTELYGAIVGGRYQIRGLIGRGATAHVFLAHDPVSGSPVAVKVLDAKHLTDKRLVARFLLEAKAAAQVTHASVVEVLDVGLGIVHPDTGVHGPVRDDGAPYLVMEFLIGESLGDRLRRDRPLLLGEALPFFRQIAEGLAAVHRAGIVHRDVKPDNVFLVGQRDDPHSAKVVDFGFAKLEAHGSLTQAGVTVGTVEYMSPEQAVSDPVDARADVYGLGVLMYRTLTARLLFDGGNAADVLARQLIEAPAPMGLERSTMADGLEAIVRKTLRKAPENRYASMDELLADLARLDRGEPLAAQLAPEYADVYVPKAAYSTKAAVFLYRRRGLEVPPQLTMGPQAAPNPARAEPRK